MTQHRRKRTALELGHDAFLDIVANLVGILIILVVILGAQSTAVIEEMQDQVEQEQNRESKIASEAHLELATHSMRAAAKADSNESKTRSGNTMRKSSVDSRNGQC